MSKLPWYKAEPLAFINATFDLPWDVKCVYRFVIDLIYANDGKLPDDDRLNAAKVGCDLRVWKRIKAELVSRGKLMVVGRFLRNARCDKEIATAKAAIAQRSGAGKASAARRGDDAPLPAQPAVPPAAAATSESASSSEVVGKSDQALMQGYAKSVSVSSENNGLASTEVQRTLNGYKIREERDSSVVRANALTPEAAKAAAEEDDSWNKRVWADGVALLGAKNRSLVGKARKVFGGDDIRLWKLLNDLRGKVETEGVFDRVEWFLKALTREGDAAARCGTVIPPPVYGDLSFDPMADEPPPRPALRVVANGGARS